MYDNYTAMVNTNVSVDEMLRTLQYLGEVQFFSFNLNNTFSYDNFNVSQKGSFLYNPQRALFGGASVVLPLGATAGAISKYDTIHNYADFITHMQGFLLDRATITVNNGIDKELLRAQGLQNVKLAGRLATKMKRFGMEIVGSENRDPQPLTTLTINTENTEPQ